MNTDTVPRLDKIEVKNDNVSEVSDELDKLTLEIINEPIFFDSYLCILAV